MATRPAETKTGEALDVQWCANHAAEAIRYLEKNCPAAAGSRELHPHQDAAHEAAVSGDRDGYLEALRAYVRAGQEVQRRADRGAA